MSKFKLEDENGSERTKQSEPGTGHAANLRRLTRIGQADRLPGSGIEEDTSSAATVADRAGTRQRTSPRESGPSKRLQATAKFGKHKPADLWTHKRRVSPVAAECDTRERVKECAVNDSVAEQSAGRAPRT